ncbi:hypothetical protein [Paractinoplanes atraurantiacus]|uniref:Uncharacterized protein n=1 Tax=Paractinoplanes atraurantiacus TaxID=1036182 RepID=A0A285IQ88_9ACTN|nr:hypothetical protein [Actinoplanes atraurantiacus]SNY49857.1 hypothetical protein SAMN05421748_110152 [Actinoplanes atraurantiacus]
MSMLWQEVFVPDSVVASDGFTAELGGTVEMSLALAVERGPGWTHEVAGRALDVESTIWSDDGWLIDVDGLGIYVIGKPVPPPGTWTTVHGRLRFAEGYETDGFVPAEEVLRRARRTFTVRRIVRLDLVRGRPGTVRLGSGEEVTEVRWAGADTRSYLLDLALVP